MFFNCCIYCVFYQSNSVFAFTHNECSVFVVYVINCFLFLVMLDMDFRVSGVNLFYLGKLEGKNGSFMTIQVLSFKVICAV